MGVVNFLLLLLLLLISVDDDDDDDERFKVCSGPGKDPSD